MANTVETAEKLKIGVVNADCPFTLDELSNNLLAHTVTGFDFEANPIVKCVLLVVDDAIEPKSIYTTVTVEIVDVNEAPITPSSQRGYITEGAGKGL